MNSSGTHNAARLLYLEDDEALARVTRGALQRKGFVVAHCATIEQAMAELETLDSNSVESPAVYSHALLDLKVGQQTSLQLVQPLRRALPACKILVLTGYGSIATAVQAIRQGADNYITKPASIDEIMTAFDATASRSDMNASTGAELDSLSLRQVEWETIQQALEENGGNISATARQLKMHRRTLQRKLQKKPLH